MMNSQTVWLFVALLMGPARAVGAEPPDLEAQLIKAGWLITPEQSATYAAGDIYTRHQNTPVVFRKDCFSGEPREGEYTSMEVVQALKLGARFPLGVARFKLKGMQYKQVRYASPYVSEFSEMKLVPSVACRNFLQQRDDLADLYVIQSVLSAEVSEQLCRSLDGRVGVVGFRIEGGLKQECNQGSAGHVAVAYKTIPLALLLRRSEGMTIGGDSAFMSDELSIEGRLKQRACQEAAEKAAGRSRAGRAQQEIRAAQTDAGQAWATLAVKLKRCHGLPESDRTPCAEALDQWLEVAKSLTVHMRAGAEHVPTACGLEVVAFPSEVHQVSVPEIAVAESEKRSLQAIVGDGADANGDAITFTVSSLRQSVDKMVLLCEGIPPQQGVGPITVTDGKKGMCRVQGFEGIGTVSATFKAERAGRYGCFARGDSRCEWLRR